VAVPVYAEPDGTAVIVPVAPAACPASGCAAGQRLSYRLEYEVGSYDKSIKPNVKVCVYIPSGWLDSSSSSWLDATTTDLSGSGGITGVAYTQEAACAEDTAPPASYTLAAAASAAMDQNFFQDTLDLSFRINAKASGMGSILLRVFEFGSAASWAKTSQIFTSQLTVAPRSTTAFVASSPAACASDTPCYLNSAGDLADGFGTGLRDAVDALDAAQQNLRVVVLDSAELKSFPVVVNKPVTIAGADGSSLITLESGAACTGGAAMLAFTNGGGLTGLTVTDGACSGAVGRVLLAVDSPTDVLVEANNLVDGADALKVKGNSGNLTVRYNEISGNSGYALFWDNTPSTALLRMVANNINGNVDCSAGASAPNPNRQADHNYWGSPAAPNANTVHCSLATGKQLGAPIEPSANGVGLDARRVTVGTTKTYAFDNQIAYQRTGGASDFDLYIVNHGSSSPDSIPFAGSFSMPNLCSNVWDVFLADGTAVDGELDLFLRYNLTAACTAAVEIPTFCGQTTNPQNYPLWWHDPLGSITAGWDTTGQTPAGSGASGATGQTTSCSLTEHEIKVAIDASGRPGLADDLHFTPFFVGLPVTNTLIPLASDKAVTLNWTTVSEPDVQGYVVLRSLAAGGPFEAITDVIARRGSAVVGSTYTYSDTGLTNGTTYYYRLKLERTDGGHTFSDVVSVAANIATVTPTPTVTRTPTITITFTPTRTFTPRPTLTPFRFPTTAVPAATRVPSRTPTRFASPTSIRTTPQTTRSQTARTQTPGALTVVPTQGAYPEPGQELTSYPGTEETATPIAVKTLTPGAGTRTALANATKITQTPSRSPAPTLSYAEQVRNSSRYVSLVMGLLLGGFVFVAAAWLIFFRKRPV
jgi:hypothetical protein